MSTRLLSVPTFCFIALAVIILAVMLPFLWRRLETKVVGAHQRSTTRELAEWEEEFRHISNDEEAFRAVDMLVSAKGYYVPGPGYRSDPQTEAALEEQRKHMFATVTRALTEFSGKDFGMDVEKWQKWKESRQAQLQKAPEER